MSENHAKFVAKITDHTINFGSRYKFTFRLRPDGKLEGRRNDSGILNTTVLSQTAEPAHVLQPATDFDENRKLAAFSGRWVGIWDNNPLYPTSLTIEFR